MKLQLVISRQAGNLWNCLRWGRLTRACDIAALCLVLLVLGSTTLSAHKLSDSYVTIRLSENAVSGEWHLALRDLEEAIGLDANDDGMITWNELRSQQANLFAYSASRLTIRDERGVGRFVPDQLLVDTHSDGTYAVIRFSIEGMARPRFLSVEYNALFDVDRLHRGLVRIERGHASQFAIMSPEVTHHQFDLTGLPAPVQRLQLIKEGIEHIWTGYDHILFLIALLLPGVLWRGKHGWEPEASSRAVWTRVLKTVTAFTVAHSITLSVAAFGVFHPPSRWIEVVIAVSVALAALNNLHPIFSERAWLVAFAFGLIHGFGFANALGDVGLRREGLARALFLFNAGVELGQLAIVSAFLPLALQFRRRPFYRKQFLQLSSAAIALVAGAWIIERLWNTRLLPF